MTPPQTGRRVVTVLDALRARVDLDDFDAALFALEAVVADLGYGDVRPLPGAVAWIDRLRADGKRTALTFTGESAQAAVELAGIGDRFDAVVTGPRGARTVRAGIEELGTTPERAVLVDVDPAGIAAANEAGCLLALAVARGQATPEALRQAGAAAVLADLQELLVGPLG